MAKSVRLENGGLSIEYSLTEVASRMEDGKYILEELRRLIIEEFMKTHGAEIQERLVAEIGVRQLADLAIMTLVRDLVGTRK